MSERTKVLIVEHDEDLADSLYVFLRLTAHDVRMAHTGMTAISVAADFAPHVLLLAARLPDMSGLRALDAIRARQPIARCVLMAAQADDALCQEASLRGIRVVLLKPFALTDLKTSIPRSVLIEPSPKMTTPTPRLEGGYRERRQRDRRQNLEATTFPFQLAEGDWLFADRRSSNRRGQYATSCSMTLPGQPPRDLRMLRASHG